MRVATDPQPRSLLDDLDKRDHQVTDERVPAGSGRGEPGVLGNLEAGLRQDRPRARGPTGARIQQAPDHLADLGESGQVTCGDLLGGQRDVVVREVPARCRAGLEVVMIAIVPGHPREPMAGGSVTGVRDPEDVADRSPWSQGDDAWIGRADVAQDDPRSA